MLTDALIAQIDEIHEMFFFIHLIKFSILLPLDKESGRVHFWLDEDNTIECMGKTEIEIGPILDDRLKEKLLRP